MPAHQQIPDRRSIRLRSYDYRSAGYYFITVCCHQRQALFGHILSGVMHINAAGSAVQRQWHGISGYYPRACLDEFIVMPDHLHAIIAITPDLTSKNMGAMNRAPTEVGEIVRGIKARSTHAIHQLPEYGGTCVWQRNYYEHIIRDDRSLNVIRKYIRGNPARWQQS